MSIWTDIIGTVKGALQLGVGGVRLKNSSGKLSVRNAADSADADMTCGNIGIPNNDSLTFGGLSGTTWIDGSSSANRLEFNTNSSVRARITNEGIVSLLTIRTNVFTVATLPAGTAGMHAIVSDAANPTNFHAIVTGGGSTTIPVYFDGTDWRIH